MAPKRGWCKHCLDDYRHGDVIVRCSTCPRSFHRECLDNDLLAHATHSAYYQNGENPLDLTDFTCDSCLQYAQEAEIVNDERCKICKERNRDETDVLLLCDGCPNSYHMSCLNLQIEPDSDKWYCPMCKPEAFEGVNVRAQRRNPLTDTAEHVNSSICYVCQRHGKLLGCDFCSNSFHYDCLPEFDIDTIADVWECPCCRGEDPFLNQMHKRWTISQIEKNSRTRRKSILTWRGVITRYRNRFILAHREELSSFVPNKIIDQLTKSFISSKNKNKKDKLKDVESQLELLQEEQLIESNKFVIKARKSCYYPSGRRKDNRPMRTGVNLKPHQEDGVDWLLKSFLTGGAILADEMGLGKTIQTLCFLSYLKMMNIEGPHLIVVPLSTVGNWLREIHRFTPHLTVIKICGSKTERQHAMSDRLAYSGLYDLFVTTYETVKCEEAFFVETVSRWQCLILDEAHRIKNQSGALRHSMDRIVSNMRLLLTGTPLQNNAQELFTLINFMFPDLFRESQIMEQAFNAKKRPRSEIEMNFTNEELDAIKLLLSRIMLRRLKEQAISLPKKVFHDVWLPLSQETLKWYRTLMNIKSLMKDNMSIKKLLGIVIKMRIICGHPRGIVSRAQQLDKLYAFFKQEEVNIQKKVENDANELKALKGLSHIHASAKLTFLDKLLCQLHYENCRLVPNYHRSYQLHLKALDNSLYRKYTTALNESKKDNEQKEAKDKDDKDNKDSNDTKDKDNKSKVKKENKTKPEQKDKEVKEKDLKNDDDKSDDMLNKLGLKQQTLEDSFSNLSTVKGLVKSEQEEMLKNLSNFNLQVKSQDTNMVKSELDDNDTNINNSNVQNNMNLYMDSKTNDVTEHTGDKDDEDTNKSNDNTTSDNKDNDKSDDADNDEKKNKKKYYKKKERKDKKIKISKEEVLKKVDTEFIRVPSSTCGIKLYLSENIKEVNLTKNCPYESMKIYEKALEQEDMYKKDKKKSTYKFESTRLVEIVSEEQESLMNYVNDPNKKTNRIIESDDDEYLEENKSKENKDEKTKEDKQKESQENTMDLDKDNTTTVNKVDKHTNADNKNKDDKNLKFMMGVKVDMLNKSEKAYMNQDKNKDRDNKDTKLLKSVDDSKSKQVKFEQNDMKLDTTDDKNTKQDNDTNKDDSNSDNKDSKNKEKKEKEKQEKEKDVKKEYRPYDQDDEDDDKKQKIRMHKVLVFTQFQLVLDELESYCINRGWKYMRLDGSTNKLIRELDIREFNSKESNYFVYLISTRAGGLGINLTAANHVVLYDEDWNPFIDLQAIDRAHRIGQKRDVHIWKLISEWTVEERMALIREKKLQLDKLILHTNVADTLNNFKLNGLNSKDNKLKGENEKEENNMDLDKDNTNNTNPNVNDNEDSNKTDRDNKDTTTNENNIGDKDDNANKLEANNVTDKLLDEDDVIISLSHAAILKMMMHGNKALQHLECEQIVDMSLDEIVDRKRKLPPQDFDDTNDIVDDILISKSNQVEGDDRVIIELVKEEDEMDIVQEESEKVKKKKVSGLLVKDLINEEDVDVQQTQNEAMEQDNYDELDKDNENQLDLDLDSNVDVDFVDPKSGTTGVETALLDGRKTGARLTPRSGSTLESVGGFGSETDSMTAMGSDQMTTHYQLNNDLVGVEHASVDGSLDGDGPTIETATDIVVEDNYNENATTTFPRRGRRARMMMEMEQAGLLWRSVREKKKPNMIYTPVEWQRKAESRVLKHENKCFLCGKQKGFVAKYKDKDDNEVEVDYGDMIKCFRCPKVYHKFCERLNVLKRNWCCRWHECCLCFRKSSQCGNLLIHCSNCPTSFCYDCFPPDYTRHYVSDDYYYNLTQRGLMANTTNWIFFLCSKCKIESERKKRSMSGEQIDKHKKEQKELRSELLSTFKDKEPRETTRDRKKLRSLMNKQEKARIDILKAKEAALEEKHRTLYQSLFPINMIAELTARINNDLLSSANIPSVRALSKPPVKKEKGKPGRPRKEVDKDDDKSDDEDKMETDDKDTTEHGTTNKDSNTKPEDGDKDNKNTDERDEREDEDWGVGLRAKRRGLNFSNVRLPHKLLQFCDNCRIPLHNVMKNPTPCPFPKESVKLDLEINIRKPKTQSNDGSADQSSLQSKDDKGTYDQGSSSGKSLDLDHANAKDKDKDKDSKTKDDKSKEDKEEREDKKVIKKGYCSKCYEKRDVRSSHFRRHCEFLSEEDRKEYKHRNELVLKAMSMLECLVSTTSNNIDYSQYSNVKLKSLYYHMLDQCDSLYLKALVDVGLLVAPKDPIRHDNRSVGSDEANANVFKDKGDYNTNNTYNKNNNKYNNNNQKVDNKSARYKRTKDNKDSVTNTTVRSRNTNSSNNRSTSAGSSQNIPISPRTGLPVRRTKIKKKDEDYIDHIPSTREISTSVIQNIKNLRSNFEEEKYMSNVDNKGLADYVRSFNSIYRHRSNRDTLLLPIVYEEPKKSGKN